MTKMTVNKGMTQDHDDHQKGPLILIISAIFVKKYKLLRYKFHYSW